MKERPILFGTPMIQAILRDAKTQTRRAIKGAPENAGCAVYSQPWQQPGTSSALFFAGPTPESRGLNSVKCPYGVPGDRLWVRESARVLGWGHLGEVQLEYSADGVTLTRQIPLEGPDRFAWERWNERMCEKAEALGAQYDADGALSLDGVRFPVTPGIYMARWASRITLEITSVRVERLHDITDLDALSEGVTSLSQDWVDQHWPEYAAERDRVQAVNAELKAQGQSMGFTRLPLGPTPRERFEGLWRDVNGADSWAANPWVWAMEFERVLA